MTGDDHNTDALIAALRSPALPAERAGEAAAVTAMLGVLARAPASTRFRAGRGIAIAVVTVASLGVGGLAAAGPGVFQAAASKARSFVTADSAETSEDAGAANGGDPLSGSLLDDASGVDPSAAAVGRATAARTRRSATPAGASPAAAVTPTAPPPECAEGNHGDAVSVVANSSVPPSAEQDHEQAVTDAAHDAVHPARPARQRRHRAARTRTSPRTSRRVHRARRRRTSHATPPDAATGHAAGHRLRPSQHAADGRRPAPPISTPGSGNGQGSGNGDQGGQGTAGPRHWRQPGPSGQQVGQGGQSTGQGRRQRGLIGRTPSSVNAVSMRDPHHTGHRSIRGGLARAAVFGASDGLVSNVSLLLGFAGSGVAVGVVRLAGLAGAVAGGISMAAGEWVSVSSQNDLIERELDVERRELRVNPEQETAELAAMYEQHGMGPERARSAAAEVMQQPDMALAVHAREEFGIDPERTAVGRSAPPASRWCASCSGAFLPLIPWFFGGGAAAAWASLAIGLAGGGRRRRARGQVRRAFDPGVRGASGVDRARRVHDHVPRSASWSASVCSSAAIAPAAPASPPRAGCAPTS